ncbi:sulfotransferase [Elysia marginata]|uniref:Sulfotransferase n=1 Tax=Elysia marginata TaxID=1093978 RepID=A0AAV4FVH7_9GAST|nr:sulfotransferase [Elysia marginata]
MLDAHQQTQFMSKAETTPRRSPCSRTRCVYNIRTLQASIVIACAIVFALCVWMFKIKDSTPSFSLSLPMDGIFSSPNRPSEDFVRARKWEESWASKTAPSHERISKTRRHKSSKGSKKSLLVRDDKRFKNRKDESSEKFAEQEKITKSLMTKDDTSRIEQGRSKKFPGAIIIGARKAGTRALLEYLNIHPQVVVSHKEMHFFDLYYQKGMEWYRSKMPLSGPGQLTMEKTPKYLITERAPAMIHSMNSSVRLVLTLRHPVNRVISDFAQMLDNHLGETFNFTRFAINPKSGTVNTKYQAIYVSTYHIHVARWLEFFPLKQIHIVDGDRLISEPLDEIRKVETFLGLSPFYTEDVIYFNATRGFYCMRHEVGGVNVPSCLGDSKGRDHPRVNSWVRDKLTEYFYPHNEKLFRMINRRFDWS